MLNFFHFMLYVLFMFSFYCLIPGLVSNAWHGTISFFFFFRFCRIKMTTGVDRKFLDLS